MNARSLLAWMLSLLTGGAFPDVDLSVRFNCSISVEVHSGRQGNSLWRARDEVNGRADNPGTTLGGHKTESPALARKGKPARKR